MGKTKTIHWRAPFVMVSAFIVSIIIAGAHHAFYASLESTPVRGGTWTIVGWTTSQQELNTAAGTAFAFVIKAGFVLSTSIAYMQLFFRAVHTRDLPLSKIDNYFGCLDDIVAYFSIATYWRTPLMTIVALTAWILPIAAIVSPAALSVTFDKIEPSPNSVQFIPQPAFESLAFSDFYFTAPGTKPFTGLNQSSLVPLNANAEVFRIAYATAAAGSILPITPPGANATWNVSFAAPRLVCADMDAALKDAIKTNIGTALNDSSFGVLPGPGITSMYSYIAWSATAYETSPMPFVRSYDQQYDRNTSWSLRSTSGSSGENDIFILIVPSAIDRATNRLCHGVGACPEMVDHWIETGTALRCTLKNTNYVLQFTYSGLSQNQHVEVLSAEDIPRPRHETLELSIEGSANRNLTIVDTAYDRTSDGGTGPVMAGSTSNTAILPSYTGAVDGSQPNGDVQNITSLAVETMRAISYSAIQDSIMAFLLGATNVIEIPRGRNVIPTKDPRAFGTQVFATFLAKTKELAAIGYAQPTAEDISNSTGGPSFDQAGSLLPNKVDSSSLGSFKDALEELYFNVTVSMASSPRLTYNASSLLAPAPVNVTYNIYSNVYSYAAAKLWLAYGLAAGVTLINIMIGLWAMINTGASYTSNFSTIVRVAKNAEFDVAVDEPELPGRDPLPKFLKKTELRLHGNEKMADDSGLDTMYEGVRQDAEMPKGGLRIVHLGAASSQDRSRSVSPEDSLLERNRL